MKLLDTDEALSVSAYASRLSSALRQVGGAILEGEVQEPSMTRGGMLFFDLTDGRAVLGCKVFPHSLKKLKARPKHGDLVRVTVTRPDLHSGNLKLAVSDIELAGVGALLHKREELLKSLTAAGLTDPDRWKRRPWLPGSVGVIAGRESKAMTDVTRALIERFPPVSIVTCPALVQGLKAPNDLIDALVHLDRDSRVEVIILARGGGSVQDLVAFDDERLCKAAFACPTPVIAAVGHSDNVPVVNHVTWSATTPSRAPELAVPAAQEIKLELGTRRQALAGVPARLQSQADRVEACAARLEVGSRLEGRAAAIREIDSGLARSEERVFVLRERGLERSQAALTRVPLRLPKREWLAEPRARLDAAVRTLFSDRGAEVERYWETLSAPGLQTLERLILGLQEHAERIQAGTRRELADHEGDYGRATERLARESQQMIERALEGRRRELERQAETLFLPSLNALERLLGGVGERGSQVETGTRRELTDHERDYGRATERLANESRAVIERVFEGQRYELVRQGEAMFVPGVQALERLTLGVQENAERVQAGTRRELADHERDYGRATERLISESRQVVERILLEEEREIGRVGSDLSRAIAGGLDIARRDADHLTALVRAHDQRNRGWVLPQDESGRAIKFPPGVPMGKRFSLNFSDGRQWVVADNIELEEGSR